MRIFKLSLCLCSLLLTLACGGSEEAASTEGAAAEGTPPATTETAEPSGPVDTSMPGDPDAGAAVYASTCVACHAANGQGNGGMTGADFVNDESRLAKDNAVLIRSITDGVLTASPPMPGHGTILTETQIRDVLSYIRREFGQN